MANKLMFIVSCAILVACSLAAITGRSKDDCAPDCKDPLDTYFMHPQNCNQFYQCSNNVAHLKNCSEGLQFDPSTHACRFPSEFECTADPTFDCSGGSGELTTVAPVEDCVPPCPASFSVYPDPRNCNRYYQCDYGVPQHRKCPLELHYSLADDRCEFAANAGCTAGPDTPCEAVTRPPLQ